MSVVVVRKLTICLSDEENRNDEGQQVCRRERPQKTVQSEENRQNNGQRYAENNFTGHRNSGGRKGLSKRLQIDKGTFVQSCQRHQAEINMETLHGEVCIVGTFIGRAEQHGDL